MYEPMLPQGDAAALMPGASYSVPGLFLYADLIYAALDQVKAKFDYDIPVKYIYGSPQVRWNCGRPVLIDHGYTDADLEAELRKAVDRGITNGLSPDQFGPNTICNRAQIVTFLYRAYG